MRFQRFLLCTLLVAQPALGQDRTQPRRLDAGELRANFRSFEETEKVLINQRITTRNSCPERVQIGGTVTASNAPTPFSIESKTIVMDSKIAVFCGL